MIFRRFSVHIFENFPPFICKGSKIWSKFGSAKGKGLKVPDTHPYHPLYRSAPPPPPRRQRALFRSKGYFREPKKVNLLKSVTGEALSQELINLTTLETDLEEVYLNTFVENPAKSSAVLEKNSVCFM